MPSRYFFLLGRTPALSLAELEAVTGVKPEVIEGTPLAVLDLADDDTAIAAFHRLGGCIKLAKDEGQFALPADIETNVTAFLAQWPRPTFAVAELVRPKNTEAIDPLKIKSLLKAQGHGSRFIESNADGLTAAVLLHHKVIEVLIVYHEDRVTLTQTLAVQDIDDWTKRDRGKPYSDRRKGMVPPKLARTMVNLALSHLKPEPDSQRTVYDPFCGTGTVLAEAMMMGCQVYGSDLDQKAIIGTQDNLAWLSQAYNLHQPFHVWKSDVAAANLPISTQRVDAIITEPFLGKPKPAPGDLKNMFKGLEKLYIGAFKHWQRILKQDGVVVIILPLVTNPNHVHSLESSIDKFAQLGYTAVSEPITYARPDAVTQRQIWQFRFHR